MLFKAKLLIGAFALVAIPSAAIAALDAAKPPIVRKIPNGPPSMMTNSAIAEHNKELAARHPDFIRCRKIEIIGSLVKKARVCRTNAEWEESWQQGNDNVRGTADAFKSKFECTEGCGAKAP